ncbi:MAG TPA: GDP-mannose 4,6-dehydratase [bacterium]|nr:GDP-mannose 4,6-dehydratase [bacterium]
MNAFWKNRRCFVTGATGLLGGWLTRALLEHGAEVTVLVRDRVPASNLHRLGLTDQVTAVHGALEEYDLLERALNEYEIDTVFHLGAQTIVQTANRNPLGTFRANIAGTWNLLEAARRNAKLVRRVLVASSDKAYGTADVLPYDEATPLRGQHPYDVSKSCADLIAQAYVTTYGLPVCVTRCGNLFGGGDLNFNRIVPGTIRSLLAGERPVIRSDGQYLRDYIYVEDAATGYLTIAEQMDRGDVAGQAFNLSYEQPQTVLALTERLTQLLGRTDLTPDIRNEASGEIRAQHLSAAKAKRLLGWQPQVALDEGLTRTVTWYRDWLRAH